MEEPQHISITDISDITFSPINNQPNIQSNQKEEEIDISISDLEFSESKKLAKTPLREIFHEN